jgi:hypothetical protein
MGGTHISLSLFLYSPLLGLRRFFTFLILYTVGGTPWTSEQPVARPLPTHSRTQNKRTQTYMPGKEFEHTIPVFERSKTVRTLDRASTVIGGVQVLVCLYHSNGQLHSPAALPRGISSQYSFNRRNGS